MLETLHPPKLSHIEPMEPELLEGDKIQRGHPLFGLIWINPERVSGTPCFYASRVPVKTLFDCFASGETLEDFLDGFYGVTREQALGVLQLAASGLLAELESL
jgi:uncharacterized protein (DUF433 family)